MNLVLFTHPAFLGIRSIARYTDWIASEMRGLGHSVSIYFPKPYCTRLPFLKKWMGYIDMYIIFPFTIKKVKRKCPTNTIFILVDNALGPWATCFKDKKMVVHCHDFIAQRSALGGFPENQTSFSGKLYQSYIRNGLKKAHNFICISEATKKDLFSILGYPAITQVIYNGISDIFKPVEAMTARTAFGQILKKNLSNGYFLHVGGNQWYKNRYGVIAAYICYQKKYNSSLPLVLIGEPPTMEMIELIRQSGFEKMVYILENITDEVLIGAYSGASLLLFPSLAEGFGWPIGEAMKCGCQVLTTGAAPMDEVGGSAAYYIPKLQLAHIDDWCFEAADKMYEILHQSPDAIETRKKIAWEYIQKFDSKNAILQMEEFYKKVLVAK